RIVFTKTESDCAARQLFVAAQCSDHRRRLERSPRTGRAGRDCYALQVEMNQQTLAFNETKRDVRQMRQATFAVAVENDVVNKRRDLIFKPVAKTLRVLVAFIHFRSRQLSRRSEGNDVRHRFGARTTFSLLMSANLL